MNKYTTTLSEIEKVERWVEKKYSENADLRVTYKVNNNLKYIVEIQHNSEQICLAEKWLAHERVKIQPTDIPARR